MMAYGGLGGGYGGGYGCSCSCSCAIGGFTTTGVILVLFILLVIVSRAFVI